MESLAPDRARKVLPLRSSALCLALLLAACAAPSPPVSDAPAPSATVPSSPDRASAGSASPASRDDGWIADLQRLVSAREEFHP